MFHLAIRLQLRGLFEYFVVLLIGLSLLFSLLLPFNFGWKGSLVEVNPLSWVILFFGIAYVVNRSKKSLFPSLILIFFIGLFLRLIVATHSSFPGVDPWNELASIHRIQLSGFDLHGLYYHSYTPILQILLLIVIPVSGEYNALTFFGPIFGWIIAFTFFYKLSREFFTAEKAILILLLYSCANIGFQYLTTPENIALGIGFATVFFFIRSLKKSSRKYVIGAIGSFSILIFAHNLTSFCVILVIGAIVAIQIYENRRSGSAFPTGLFMWLTMLAIFFSYYELYIGQLSSLLVINVDNPMIGLPTGWLKPIWWWALYVLPEVLLLCFITPWIISSFRSKRIPKPSKIFAVIFASLVTLGSSFVLPQSLPPLRVFNQFGGYFFEGTAQNKRFKITIVLLCGAFLVGLMTQFPMMTENNTSYIGGYWISHTSEEVSAMKYISINVQSSSRIIMDSRCSAVLDGLAPASKNIAGLPTLVAFQVYNTSSSKNAWEYCIYSHANYIFVTKFYNVIAAFGVYTGAQKFSDTQLTKFSAPYFEVFYGSPDSQVCVYSVNSIVNDTST